MPKPFQAYQGEEPFIFVSYAHEDSEAVFRVMKMLRSNGFNVWYDDGIHPGSVWRDEIANRILKCEVFLYFLSPHSAESKYCAQEANFAVDHEKQTLVVHLESTIIPPGLLLTLSDRQAILKYDLPDNQFTDLLLSALSNVHPGGETLDAYSDMPPTECADTEMVDIAPLSQIMAAQDKPVWFIRISQRTKLGPITLFFLVAPIFYLTDRWLHAEYQFHFLSLSAYSGSGYALGNALALAYTISVVNFVLRKSQTYLDNVRHCLRVSETAYLKIRHFLLAEGSVPLFWIALAGVPFALLVNYLQGWRFVSELILRGKPMSVWDSWATMYQALVWIVLFQAIYLFAKNARLFSLLGRRYTHINLLRAEELAPFFFAGLNNMLIMVGGLSIIPIVYLVMGLRYHLAIVVPILLLLGIASVYLVMVPTKGIRTRIKELKRTELANISIKMDALLASTTAGREKELADLVAYQTVVEKAKIWPVPLPFLVRFTFFVFFPPAVWIVGGVIEYLITSVN
ncbi:MAG: TIR domain-containing protein [Woeseiaceae bacterium]|nr:TIR domain-containing protein [Woeseiaceae bacterium]NIP20095.1 TIR domain-containing protein [Woeseiaceae bacterium]NIS88891.1 TIR domain-containing protein [Woeseiaceae bacterium]